MKKLTAIVFCFLAVSQSFASSDLDIPKKECKAKKYASCEEVGVSLLLDNKLDESYSYLKMACEKENLCLGLATYYEKKGKFEDARKLLKENCQTSASACYDLSDFEKKHGSPSASREALFRGCEKKFMEKKCQAIGQKDQSETSEDKEIKNLFCKGPGCSDFEKYQSQIAETYLRMRKLNVSCQKNDGGSCSDLAVLLKAAEQTTPEKFKSELPGFLIKLGIKGSSQDYFKKACELKHQIACAEVK